MLKSAAKYCAVANPEIGSQKLCCSWFRNRQPQTVSLPILKSVAKSFAAADSEIGTQVLCHCHSEIGSKNCATADPEIDSKTVSLPIQKSAEKIHRC